MTLKIRKQSGLSLVELLVSIVISMIVLAGVIGVVVNSRTTFLTEQEASFMQENVRYAIELLSRDVRQAGNKDCAPDGGSWYINSVKVDATGLFGTEGLIGYEGTANTGSFPSSLDEAEAGSDAIIIRYADVENAVPITDHNSGTGVFSLGTHDFYKNQKLFIVDSSCRRYGYFEATDVAANTSATNDGSGGNCGLNGTSSEMKNVDCPLVSSAYFQYEAGSQLMPYQVSGYFIAESNVIAGVPALKRVVFSKNGARTEEIAQGIEKMEIVYGVDVSATPDGEIDAFLDANAVTDWSKVISARFTFVLRSQSPFFPENESTTLAGKTTTDRFLRQMISASVRIRN